MIARRKMRVLVMTLLMATSCTGGETGTGGDTATQLPAHHAATKAFPIAFDHPASWSNETGPLVSAFPPGVLGEAPGEADPSVVAGPGFQGVMYLPGPNPRASVIGADDRVITEASTTIDGLPATRTEVELHDGGWTLHAALFVVDVAGPDDVGMLFLANDQSFDAALFDAVAASARLEGPTTATPA